MCLLCVDGRFLQIQSHITFGQNNSYICDTIPLGTYKKARPINVGSHNLQNHLNQLNTEGIPAK